MKTFKTLTVLLMAVLGLLAAVPALASANTFTPAEQQYLNDAHAAGITGSTVKPGLDDTDLVTSHRRLLGAGRCCSG